MSVAALMAAVAVPSVAVAQTGEVGPRLRVGLGEGEATYGDSWTPGATVTVTADNPDTEVSPDFLVEALSTADGGFMLPTGFDGLQPGWLITATDGVHAKTHTVKNISITDVDLEDDLISGTADPGATLDYVGSGKVFEGLDVLADENGMWSVDLTGIYDVRPGGLVVALQIDDPGCVAAPPTDCDADFSNITWYVPDVHVEVDTVQNMILGFDFQEPVTVKVDGNDPGGTIEYEDNSFALYLYPQWGDGIDLVPGQVVEVSDATTTKSVILADLAITGWDFAENTLWGTTDQAANVLAQAWNATGAGFTQAEPTDTTWIVDFDLGEDQHDLRVVDSLEVQQFDDDGDATTVTGVAAGPRFVVGLEVQEVQGIDWPADSSVTLTIDTPPLGSVDWTGTTTPGDPQSNWLYGTGGQGGAYFDLNATNFQVRPGDVLTMSDGTTTKVLVVPPLTTDVPDVEAEEVSGTATVPADSFLTVVGDGNWTHGPQHEATVTDDTWSVSFAGDEDYSMTDTVPYAWITDLDGDTTESMAPRPQVWIDPSTDRIWALDLGAVTRDADVTLTVARPGQQVFTDTVTPVNLLTRGSWNLDMWATPAGSLARPAVALFDLSGVLDVQGGDVVTVTDGEVVRTVTVAHLTVDSANAVTEVVSGTADPTVPVGLHLGDGEGGFWGYEAAPTADNRVWSYYFDPDHFASPPGSLSVGMTGQAIVRPGTVVRWTVGSAEPSEIIPLVVALPLTNQFERGLIGKLNSAQSAYDTGRTATGTRLMTSFINSVNGLTPKKLSATDAAELVAAARQVIAAHGG